MCRRPGPVPGRCAARHGGRLAARSSGIGAGRGHPVYLDPPAEAPLEFIAKAARYGWPVDADLTPVWLTTGQHGPADLDRTAVQRLTVAIAAVLAHDRRPDRCGPTTGTCALAADQQGAYTLNPAA